MYIAEYIVVTLKWDGKRYIELANKLTFSSSLTGAAVSGDGKVLILYSKYSTSVRVYDWSDEGFTWVFRQTFNVEDNGGASGAHGISTNEDGTMFFARQGGYPGFKVYFFDGTVWTKMGISGGLTYLSEFGKFSKDGKRLIVSNGTSFRLFNLISGTWTADNSLPSVSSKDVSISEDGNTVAVCSYTANASKVYDDVDGSWVVRPSINTSAGEYESCALSNDGKTVVFVGRNAPRVIVEDFNGTYWSRRAIPTSLPGGIQYTDAFIKN